MADPPEIADNLSADSTNPPETLNNTTVEPRRLCETADNPPADSTNSPEATDHPTTNIQTDNITTVVCETDEPVANLSGKPSEEQSSVPIAMEDLCRLCLSRCTGEMQRIFDDVTFPDNILALAQLQIHLGDGLPEHVCKQCVYQLKSTRAFIALCRHSDHTIRDYLDHFRPIRTLTDPRQLIAFESETDQEQRSVKGCGEAARVSPDCSETSECVRQVAAQYTTSILSGLLQRPSTDTARRIERETDVARRRENDVENAMRDAPNGVGAAESNVRQPMDITNVVNNRHLKDLTKNAVLIPRNPAIIDHYAPPTKQDQLLTNCEKHQDPTNIITSNLIDRNRVGTKVDSKFYGAENHFGTLENTLNRLNRSMDLKSVNGFITSDRQLLKTIKVMSKDSVFDKVESQLDLMMNNNNLIVEEMSKDMTVKLLNGRNKGDQNKRSIYIDQALNNLQGQLNIHNGKRGKSEMSEELRNGLNKHSSKKLKYGDGIEDISPKRSLCEDLLSSFRGQVIEAMTVYVASTETNVSKREDAQVKAGEENVENVQNAGVVVEALPGNKDEFQTTVLVEGSEHSAETIANGITTEQEVGADTEETILIRILHSDGIEIHHGTNSEEPQNLEENYQEVYIADGSTVNDLTAVHFKDEQVDGEEQFAEEPTESDEVITGDSVYSLPANGGLLRCKLEEGTEDAATDKVYIGSEINGEILYFDVQEEVVIETADFDLNNLPIEESTQTILYPGTSVDTVVIKTEDASEYAFACETCTKSFKRKKALLSHMKLHTFINFGVEHEQKRDPTNKVYKCDVCFKCYISKAGLKNHKSRVHEEGKYACPECELVFASKVALVAHLKSHKQKVHKCNRCLKTFQKRKTFVAHTRIHAQNVYKCATCLETYGDEDDLKEHFKSHKAHDVATGQSQPASRNEAQVEQFQRMKFEYCLSYVGLVKSMFETQPDLYNGFLDTIKDFKFQRINVQGLLVQISQLFKDHRELIAGFNTFMPHGFKIELPLEDKLGGAPPEVVPVADQQGPDMDLDYSLSYLSQIKSMFSNQPKIYNDFTYIIKEYKLKTMEIPEVIRRVSYLFRDYPELIAGFNSFLPPWCKIKVATTTKKEKEDIDPMDPSCSVRPGPSTSATGPGPCNGNAKLGDLSSPAANLVNLGGRFKRKVILPANSADHFKKVKMELMSSDKVFKTINQTNKVSETREQPRSRVASSVTIVDTNASQPPSEEPNEVLEVTSLPPQPRNIVETITSLCNQLQTIVDKQGYPSGQSQGGESVDQSQGGGGVDQSQGDVAESETPGTDVTVYSHVCHVCLKSFQKRNLLQVHLKEHKR